MPDYEARFWEMLKASGATLVRSKKHRVYRLPNNQQLVIAKSPSDVNAWPNMISELRRQLGLRAEPKLEEEKPREQRPRRRKEKQKSFVPIGIRHGEAEQAVAHSFGQKMGMALGLFREATEDFKPEPAEEIIRYKIPRKSRHEPTERHGKAISLSPEIIQRSNEILKMAGERAQREYLEEQLERKRFPEKYGEESEDDSIMGFQQLVLNAKAQLGNIDHEITALRKSIEDANKAIEVKEQQKLKLKDFVENAEVTMLAMQEAEAALRASGIKIPAMGEARPMKQGVRRVENANPYNIGVTGVLEKAMPLFLSNPEKDFNAEEVHQYVINEVGLKDLHKKFIYDALGYEARKKDPKLVRVGSGRYRLIAQSASQTQVA